jgi:AcrR family transcriptional regulator
MARPRLAVDQVATTDRLLRAAEVEFGRRGFHGAKLQDIATGAGISRPSLLYHFATKHQLYCDVVRRVLHQIGSTVREAIAGANDFDSRLEGIVTGFVGFVRGRPSAARLVMREVMDDEGPGQALLITEGLPLLELVEDFLRAEGGDRVPAGLPLRGALAQVISSAFLKASSGPLETLMWGDEDPHLALTRHLFKRRTQ